MESTIQLIYEQYHKEVYQFLICFIGNRNDAEDLTHEVFIRILKSLSKFNKTSGLKTWILSIAKHVAIDHYRRKKFYSLFTDAFFMKLTSKDDSPIEQLETKETKLLIWEAISKMKPNYRAVLILRGINELSIKETAEILECSESKVKVNYHRSLGMLEKTLSSLMERGAVNE
ncbi:sigma-70 family RNA polymerase sigma factor [Paenibacillus sp. LMG 31458]|uniref:Sigma-70 family RNA polymerase sigma factor n=1 Tax=Paenibacillus phytorum TaxID=2654977 RepID=A0ABX1Y1G0_9BACL|nr:sigma-70 family RNA polymerase sigma factor [Paenibacillus phytorum]